MKLRNISFRVKMFIVMLAVILIPMILVSTLLYKRSEQSITEQTSKVVISSIDFAVQTIDSDLDNVTGMSKLILTESRIASLAQHVPLDPVIRNERYASILDLLSFFITRIKTQNMMGGIDSFNLYLNRQHSVIDSKSTYYENIEANNIDFVRRSESAEGIERWFVSTPVDYYSLHNISSRLESDKQITYNKVLKDEQDKPLAVLAVNINETYISDYYRKIQRGIPGDFVVLDDRANVIAASDKTVLGTTTELYSRIGGKIRSSGSGSGSFFITPKQFVVYSVSGYTKWRYVVIIPAADILGKVYEMRQFLFILISVTALFIFAVTYFLSNWFYKPLLKLVKVMQKVENRNLDVRIDDNRKDEYRQVYQGFNDMADELKVLIRDLANEKILKQEAEIKLLQAQINPHFLYNTLDSIYSIAKIKKVEEISQLVASLSKFFRISLSGGKELVTLQEAVNLVVHYLTILNIRYRGEISFHVDYPEQLAHLEVPKLLLQPLVENSVYHGIEKKRGHGHIAVTAASIRNRLHLVVEDNGMGMTDEQLSELRRSLSAESREETMNFALRNLNRQIKLKYGQDYGIRIESIYGEWTKVTIEIPIVRKGELHA